MGLLPSEFLLRATPFDLEVLRLYDAKFLLGDMRQEFLHGHWCSTYVNSKLDRSTAPFGIEDFMILHKPKQREQSTQDIKASVHAWAKALGATVTPRKTT